MVMDSDNILIWQLDNFGSGYSYSGTASEGTASFSIPLGSDWYAFMDNSLHHRNAVKINGGLLFQHTGTAVQDETIPNVLLQYSIYPNPFNKTTCLSLKADKDFKADISILNLKGQVVKSWQNTFIKQGNSDFYWDGKDNKGSDVSSGVYFWKVQSRETAFTNKILYLK